MHEENSVQAQLVGFARRIAVHQGYPDLVNGLQPLERLLEKYKHEKEEFDSELAADDGSLDAMVKILSEAADLLYYSACLKEQGRVFLWNSTRGYLVLNGIDIDNAKKAAIIKYDLRSAAPNSKDFDKENAAIKAALFPEE